MRPGVSQMHGLRQSGTRTWNHPGKSGNQVPVPARISQILPVSAQASSAKLRKGIDLTDKPAISTKGSITQ
jgi:hypothetical protein